MAEKKPAERTTSADTQDRSISSRDIVLPKTSGEGSTNEARIHIEYSDEPEVSADRHPLEEPIRHIPPTPVIDATGDSEPSPPVAFENEDRDNSADAITSDRGGSET